jgi:hypothetical protein
MCVLTVNVQKGTVECVCLLSVCRKARLNVCAVCLQFLSTNNGLTTVLEGHAATNVIMGLCVTVGLGFEAR